MENSSPMANVVLDSNGNLLPVPTRGRSRLTSGSSDNRRLWLRVGLGLGLAVNITNQVRKETPWVSTPRL